MAYVARSEFPLHSRPAFRPNVKVISAAVVIALAVGYLIFQGVQSSAEYFLTVSELQSKGAAAANQSFRVSGTLVPGSLHREANGLQVEFQIADDVENDAATTAPLSVVYRGGQVPDIIGDDIQIVADGKVDAQGNLQASSILAKCPSHLEDATPQEYEYSSSASS